LERLDPVTADSTYWFVLTNHHLDGPRYGQEAMPRRTKAEAFNKAIGARIRELRREAGITLEKLAYESDLGSKGHLSNIENGLVRPTAHTLKVLADRLGVLPLDLVTFPQEDERQELIDRTRHVPLSRIRFWLLRSGADSVTPPHVHRGRPPVRRKKAPRHHD
jgi:transcriptional regulator with XRE-family HTH domain